MSVRKHENFDRENRLKLLDTTFWVNYCFCGGCGLADCSDPCWGADQKCCCIRSGCESTNLWDVDGICSSTRTALCCTTHLEFPPIKGAPFRCCGRIIGKDAEGETDRKDALYDYRAVISDTFWINYCLCCGVGVSKPGASGRPYFGAATKCCCTRSMGAVESAVKDGLWCDTIATCCCIWTMSEFPVKQSDSPCCACCGFRFRARKGSWVPPEGDDSKVEAPHVEAPKAEEAPAQHKEIGEKEPEKPTEGAVQSSLPAAASPPAPTTSV